MTKDQGSALNSGPCLFIFVVMAFISGPSIIMIK